MVVFSPYYEGRYFMKHEEIRNLQLQGYGYQKIATMLSLSPNTVKSYIRRHPLEVTDDKKSDVCLTCGKELIHTSHKRKKKFCSSACKTKWWTNNKNCMDNKETTLCKYCGKRFTFYRSKNAKYCSRACYDKARIKA